MMKRQHHITLGGTAKSLEDVKKIHDLGLEFAEIPIRDPGEFSGRVGGYLRLKTKLGISYLCHGPLEGDPNDTFSLENVYLPKIMAILPLMESLQMPLLTIHLWLDPRFVKKDVIVLKISMLGRILEKTRQTGITLCIENLSENADDFMVPFAELPELFMTLDLGHAQLLSEKNTSFGLIEQFSERIKHLHVHDNRGGHSQADDLHLPPGEGIIDFEAILGELWKKGYTGTMTFELQPSEIEKDLNHLKGLIFK
jgi:sugar phosphate isomerase/epimerase